jgi:hypothetical protein
LQFGNGLDDRTTKRGEVIHFGLEACSKRNAKALAALAFSVMLGGHRESDPGGPL